MGTRAPGEVTAVRERRCPETLRERFIGGQGNDPGNEVIYAIWLGKNCVSGVLQDLSHIRRIVLLPGDDPDVFDTVREGLDRPVAACAYQNEEMVWKPLCRLDRQLEAFLVIDASRVDDRLRIACDADFPLREFLRNVRAQTLRIEAVVNAVQLLGRDPQLKIFSPGVLGMTDAG